MIFVAIVAIVTFYFSERWRLVNWISDNSKHVSYVDTNCHAIKIQHVEFADLFVGRDFTAKRKRIACINNISFTNCTVNLAEISTDFFKGVSSAEFTGCKFAGNPSEKLEKTDLQLITFRQCSIDATLLEFLGNFDDGCFCWLYPLKGSDDFEWVADLNFSSLWFELNDSQSLDSLLKVAQDQNYNIKSLRTGAVVLSNRNKVSPTVGSKNSAD